MEHRVYIKSEILDRIIPIIAQRRKDGDFVYLHTTDELRRPCTSSIVSEALEFYCDLYMPCPSTPKKLIASTGCEVPIKTCPHTGWYTPDRLLAKYWPELNKTRQSLIKKLEMHFKILRRRGLLKNQEAPYTRESDEGIELGMP